MEHTTTQALSGYCTAIEDGYVRCFLLQGSEKALLVDTGFGMADLAALVPGLTSLPVQLLNTHADADHTGGNASFGPALLHPADHPRFAEKGGDPSTLRPVQHGDVLDLGGLTLQVLHVPGHTPGSIALWNEADGTLLAGDTVQNGQIYMFGPGRDWPLYLASLQRLMKLPVKRIYASHASPVLPPEFLPALLADAKAAAAGTLPGEEIPLHGNRVLLRTGKAASFLCNL